MRIAIITSRDAAYRGRGCGATSGSCPFVAEKTKLEGSAVPTMPALSIVACVSVIQKNNTMLMPKNSVIIPKPQK